MTGIELLVRLATGDPPPPDEARKLLAEARQAPDQAAALGMDRAAKVRVRDKALADAAAILAFDDPGAWKVAERLSQAIERFERRVLPILEAGRPGSELNELDKYLHRAFLSNAPVPSSTRWLYRLLN